MPAILFVCTGNICRSPMATALFKSKLGTGANGEGWSVESAGTWAVEGQRASANAHEVMEARGLDIRDHRSRRITDSILEDFDLILTMEAGHKEALRAEFPRLAGRVYMLSEMVGEKLDVDDPIGSSRSDYEQTAAKIDDLIDQGLEKILELARRRE